MIYKISEILEITDCSLLNIEVFPTFINEIYFDTRKGNFGPHALFLAIDGKNADGHTYIDHAYHQLGTRNFMVSKAIETEGYPDANFLLCQNVVNALQALAKNHRNRFSPKVIGITGSNAKTIVKEWVFQLCEEQFNVVRSPGSYNSQIGVPLSVLKIEKDNDLAIFEAGISTSGKMLALADVIKPDWGIFTNIGEAHNAGFTSMEEKVNEKASLFNNCEKIIYCRDHSEIHNALSESKAELVSWSTEGKNASYQIDFGTEIITINGDNFAIPFKDILSKENATHAIICALELGVRPIRTEELSPVRMRLEMKQGINNSFLINDAYNSDFNALQSALKILDQQQEKQRNTLILSQLEETNLSEKENLARISALVESHSIHRLITVGEQLMKIDFSGDYHKYPHTASLLKDLRYLRFQNENVLIKGARKYNLEKVFERLSVKVHQTILEIDLEAMRHNLQVYRSFLSAETKLMVVLKASGYGSGSKELSRFLAYQRVDYIAVAYVDEGIELRKSGIKVPIMVMNPEESGFSSMIQFDLEPEIYSIRQLKSFLTYLQDGHYKIHLKIETGMHRLGLSSEDIEEVANVITWDNRVEVASIFSHLVGSDDPELDDFSKKQIRDFDRDYNSLCQFLTYYPDRHILNSNGISRFPDCQYDMVRLGIGLHGLTDDLLLKPRLFKVQKLTTKIAQIKEVSAGDSIGYNRKFLAQSEMKIATINVGYADGLPRNAGNGRYAVLFNDKHPCTIVGNVCMDMCMIDVTHVHAKVDDEVVIFGKKWPIEHLAEVCGTIPYEILTRLSTRVHRIFSRE